MISPQGYKLGEDPEAKNPFWNEGEDSDVNKIYATATVDDGTGVPSVSTSKTVSGNDITFDFAFHNLKGKDGAPGAPGAPGKDGAPGAPGATPVITITATQNGDPVTVTKGGTDAAPSFNFALTGGGGGTTGGKIRLVEETDSSVFPQYLFKGRYLAEAQYTWNQNYSEVYTVPDGEYEHMIFNVSSDIKFTWNTDTSVLWGKEIDVKFDADYPEQLLTLEYLNADKEYGVITSEGVWTTNSDTIKINSVGRMTYYVATSGVSYIKIENLNYTDAEGAHNITAYMSNNIRSVIKYADTVEKSKSLQVV